MGHLLAEGDTVITVVLDALNENIRPNLRIMPGGKFYLITACVNLNDIQRAMRSHWNYRIQAEYDATENDPAKRYKRVLGGQKVIS